jgi:hypothetical protein
MALNMGLAGLKGFHHLSGGSDGCVSSIQQCISWLPVRRLPTVLYLDGKIVAAGLRPFFLLYQKEAYLTSLMMLQGTVKLEIRK